MFNNNELEILSQFIKQDFKKRYQGSVLGVVWVLLKPLALFTVIYTVFSYRFASQTKHFSIYLLIGIMTYSLFSDSSKYGLSSLLGKSGILLQVNFDRIIVVISGMTSSLITFGFNFLVLIIFIIFERATFYPISVPIFFISLLIFTMFNTGLSLFLSIINISFRDIGNIWDIVLRVGFYATPIFIPIDFYPPYLKPIVLINPISLMMNINREAILTGKITSKTSYILFGLGLSFALFISGIIFFKCHSKKIAEKF